MNWKDVKSPEELAAFSDEKIFEQIAGACHTIQKAPQAPLHSDDVILLCIVKNGASYLPAFLAHYQKIGIKHFCFLDNGSEDETLNILSEFEQASVFQCDLPYKVYYQAFKRFLVARFGQQQWTLVVDIDEFFDYPFSPFFPLPQLISYLNQNAYDTVVTQMLDMFSQEEVGKKEGKDFRKHHRFYDISQLVRAPYQLKNKVSKPAIPFMLGGLRKMAFGLDKVYLTKHALFKKHEGLTLTHEHWVEGGMLADFSAVLYHYKFLDHFPAYVKDAVAKGYHAGNSYEYKHYQKRLKENKKLKLYTDTAEELTHVNQLIHTQFLHISPEYITAVSNYVQSLDSAAKNRMTVVTASDDAYAVPLQAMLFSLLENRESQRPLDVFVISNDLSARNKAILNELFASYIAANLHFLSLDESYFHHLPTNSDYISAVTYYRFAIPDLLDKAAQKVLYLDCDMIIRDDISKLWDTDLKGKICGGVSERFAKEAEQPWDKNKLRKMQLPLDGDYFNAGVLLINLEKWRSQGISEACIRLMIDHPERISLDDQDAMNIILKADWFPLPHRWNITTYWFQDFVKNALKNKTIYQAALNPAITHFTSRQKPWKLDEYHDRRDDFRVYWQRFSEKRFFALREEAKNIREGISLITICHADNMTFLPKALANWQSYAPIDEIILVDISPDNAVTNCLSEMDSAKIIHIKMQGNSDLTEGLLLNLGLRMSSRDKILKMDPDCLIYDLFFENQQLSENCFFSMYAWRDWFLKTDCINNFFYIYRKDLLAINGFHEALEGAEASWYAFHQLKLIQKSAQTIHYNSIYCMSKERTLLADFQPLPGISFPPLSFEEKKELLQLKMEHISRLRPWNLISQFAPLAVSYQQNQWQVSLAEPPHAPSFPRAQLTREVFASWLLTFFPGAGRYESWLREAEPVSLSKELFQVQKLAQLLLAEGRLGPASAATMRGPTSFREAELKKQLDAIHHSYSWKIGSRIMRIIYGAVGWLPFVKKRGGKKASPPST